MKELSMHLKEIPPNYYAGFAETIFCISSDKVYMVKQTNLDQHSGYVKYLFRLPTRTKVYEGMITEQLYKGLLQDIPFNADEIKNHQIFEYLYGKDTIRVTVETTLDNKSIIVAIGPEENKEWQYEFQKYHA